MRLGEKQPFFIYLRKEAQGKPATNNNHRRIIGKLVKIVDIVATKVIDIAAKGNASGSSAIAAVPRPCELEPSPHSVSIYKWRKTKYSKQLRTLHQPLFL